VVRRTCSHRNADGHLCGAAPLRDRPFCLFHDPDHAGEVAESRRLGGLRRKRKLLTRGAYEVESLTTVADIRRLLEIGVVDLLGLENSIARVRALAQLAGVALKLLEVGELEERLRSLEAAVKGPRGSEASVFDQEFEERFVLEEGAP